jgi:transcriptional regulator with XRE-family HTH domain
MTRPIEEEEILGRALAMLRASQGLTLRQVADRLQTSPSLLSRWERGVAMPRYSSAHNLLRVLGVSLTALDRVMALIRDGGAMGGPPLDANDDPADVEVRRLLDDLAQVATRWAFGLARRVSAGTAPGEMRRQAQPPRSVRGGTD